MAGTAWTLQPALLCEKYVNVLVQLWEAAGLDSFLRPVRRLSTFLGATACYSITALWNRKPAAEGLHHCLFEDRSSTEHAAIARIDGNLSESLVVPSVSQANDLLLRSGMYADNRKHRKQHKQTSCARTVASATAQEASVTEPFNSGRSSTTDDAPTPAIEGCTGHGTAPGRFSRSYSHGSSGSVTEPSSKNVPFLGAEPPNSQPGCCEEPSRSQPAESKVGCAWPRPLLQGDSDESPESSLVDNTGALPLFGVRNIPTIPKKGSRRRQPFRSRRGEDDSDNEIEAIELDVLKWMTYESHNESRGESAPPPSLSDEGREIRTDERLKTPGRFFGQLSSTEKQGIETSTVRPAIAYKASSMERCAITQDLMHLTEVHPSQLLIMEPTDDNPEGEGGTTGHGLWTTMIELGKQDSSHEAAPHSELDLEEKLAAWDPSQENSYALSSPGHIELFDLEVTDPRNSQASQQPHQARTELTSDHSLPQRSRKALPSATTDLCLYDDLKWMVEEPEKGEPEPARGKRIERLHQAGTKQRFKRKSTVRKSNTTAATSASIVHPQRQKKAPEHFNAQYVSAVPTFTASITSEAQLSSEKPVGTHSIQVQQETTEGFSVCSKLTSPPSLQAEDGQPQLVEPPSEAETSERRTTHADSEAEQLEDVHGTKTLEVAPRGLEGLVGCKRVNTLGDFAVGGEDKEKTEPDALAHVHSRAPRKRKKKRRKHRKRNNGQKRQLAKTEKKRREAATSGKKVESASKEEHEGGRPSVVRPLVPRLSTEWPAEWTSGWTLSGIGSGLRFSDFDDDEVQRQDTGDVTIRIRTSTRSKAAMVWPFGPC